MFTACHRNVAENCNLVTVNVKHLGTTAKHLSYIHEGA